MEIKGQIEDFIFQNEVNSYSIAVLDVGDIDPLTVVRISSVCRSGRYGQATRQDGSTSGLWRAIQNRIF